MRDVWRLPRRVVTRAPRHPEVHQENATALEPDNQILAAPLHRGDPLAGQLGRYLGGLVPADEPRVVDVDVLEGASHKDGSSPGAPVDLGQLGHLRPGVAAPVLDEAVLDQCVEDDRPWPRRLFHELVRREHVGRGFACRTLVRACTSASTSPSATALPRFARQTTPTAWSSRVVLLPAPGAEMEGHEADGERRKAADVARARRADLVHVRRRRQRRLVGVAALRAHPALVRGRGRAVGNRLLREPARLARSTPRADRARRCAEASRTSSPKSGGPSPRSVATASRTSSALPTAHPSGWSMSVSTHTTSRPARRPSASIASPSTCASDSDFVDAPSPTLTSSTIASAPEAIFFDMMLAAISDTLSTVAVMSLSA